MTIEKTRRTISIEFPVDIQVGSAGLVYVTSPLVRSLLVDGETESEALAQVPCRSPKLCRRIGRQRKSRKLGRDFPGRPGFRR